jgi:hypothetical protein
MHTLNKNNANMKENEFGNIVYILTQFRFHTYK